jgi:HKD family nuclease
VTSLEVESICQPNSSVIDKLVEIVNSGRWTHIDVAVAYAVVGGVQLLEEELGASPEWTSIRKRWLVGIDWCRTQPLAASALANQPRSSVRIVNGEELVRRSGCVPATTYHPKGFLTRRVEDRRTTARGLLLGSANLSRNGLRNGHELDYWVNARDNNFRADQLAFQSIRSASAWFDRLWRASTPYGVIESRYTDVYRENRTD